jgi:hypothetical protein
VQVPYGEGVATRIGPEPCADVRKGVGEASAGECTGRPLNRERPIIPGADTVPNVEGHTHGRAICEHPDDPAWSVGWDRGADRASDDADVSSIPPIIRRVSPAA